MQRLVQLSGWIAGLTFAALVVLGAVWIAPDRMLIFDTRFWGYSTDTAACLLQMLGAPDGDRTWYYLTWHRALDTVFPIALTIWLIGMIRRGWAGRKAQLLTLLPLAYLVFDLSENALVARLLRQGPDIDTGMVLPAAAMTVLKFACVVPALILAFRARKAKSGPKGQML